MAYKLGVYGDHLFSRYDPAGNAAQVAELQRSGFTYVNLSYLHIDAEASLYYNDTPIVKDGVFANFWYLPDLVANLKSNGSVQHVLFTIGGAEQQDFANVQTLLKTQAGKAALIQSLGALVSAVPIHGFDFDDEVTYNPPTTAELGQIIAGPNNFGGLIVTYCPYTNEQAWNEALQQTWDINHSLGHPQAVQWWNLQCYGGGTGNDPVAWAKALPNNVGVQDPKGFVVPGFDAAEQDPNSIRETFRKFAGTGIDGGFIYTFENIPTRYSAREYAHAILEGLEGKPQQKVA